MGHRYHPRVARVFVMPLQGDAERGKKDQRDDVTQGGAALCPGLICCAPSGRHDARGEFGKRHAPSGGAFAMTILTLVMTPWASAIAQVKAQKKGKGSTPSLYVGAATLNAEGFFEFSMWIGGVVVGPNGARTIEIDTPVQFQIEYYGADTRVGTMTWDVDPASLGAKGKKIGLYYKLDTVDEAERVTTCQIYNKKGGTLLATFTGEASSLADGEASGNCNLQWD